MQTNVQTKFAREGTEVWKRENPISGFFFLVLERKRILTLEINKNEVERASLVIKRSKFSRVFVYGKIQLH